MYTHQGVGSVSSLCGHTLRLCVISFLFFYFVFCFVFFFLPSLLLAFPLAEKAERRRAISIESVRAVAVQSLVRRSGPERDPSDRLSLFHSLFFSVVDLVFLFHLQPENQLSRRRPNNYISDTESCDCSVEISP